MCERRSRCGTKEGTDRFTTAAAAGATATRTTKRREEKRREEKREAEHNKGASIFVFG
jgi:hypothetical protein